MIKRAFDIFMSAIALVCLLPLFLVITLLIIIDSKGGVFYKQVRVGKNKADFELYKFRTMVVNASRMGQLTIGSRDSRITRVGYWLRKYKLDELPQLINILKGDMSFVGPRPEVRKYVDLYNAEQQRVFSVKPGLTDWASIQFCNENELLAQASNPEDFYIKEVMPEKLNKNLSYVDRHSLLTDCLIIFLTLKKIVQLK